MSNLNFRNVFEMSHDEMMTYIIELEKRIGAAAKGAEIFRDEANLSRTEALKYKEIAEQRREMLNDVIDIAQRKISGLSYLLEGASAVCQSWTEYETVNRMMLHHVEGICRWLNRRAEPPPPAAIDLDEVYDGIPF